MISWIFLIFFVIVIVSCCCLSDSKDSGSKTVSSNRKSYSPPQRNTYYGPDSYSECPSCGAPYFDGYCEECGYPDINQGWIGENY